MGRLGPQSFRGLIPTDLARCDGAVAFLQSGFWGSFKARFSWNARAFLIDWGEFGKTSLLVIRRRLGPKASFAYVPWGPEVPAGFPEDPIQRASFLEALSVSLQSQLPNDTAFVRYDPPWFSVGDAPAQAVLPKPFKRAGADVQPPDTVMIDLSFSEEDILASMKPKWRYNIRLGEKKNVAVRRLDEKGLDDFYKLYRETAKRDRIAIHGIEYYQTLFAHAREYRDGTQDVRLYMAEHGGEFIASIIVLFRGGEATYLYGASADHKRNLMAPYVLQWRAMVDAKASGCLRYDLFGIPPKEDPSHPMAGLYRFKTGFGGTIIHRPGSWDYPYNPIVLFLFSLAESVRRKLRSLSKSVR